MEIRAPREPSGEIRIAEELQSYTETLKVRIDEALDDYAVILLDRLYDLTPKETGETAESWEVFHSNTWEIFITNSNEPVATFLSQGTIGHWVEPVIAKALRWIGPEGVAFFSKGHMVSGITPLFIEWNALESTREDLNQLLDQAEDLAFTDAFETGTNVAPSETVAGGDTGGGESDDGGFGSGEGEEGA